MGGHFTWQDPVALVIVFVGIVLAFGLHRRLFRSRDRDCGSCDTGPRQKLKVLPSESRREP